MFTFTSSDPDSLFMCSLNGAVASPCDATEGNLTPVQGQNTLAVYSVGPGLANDATPATYTWSVNDTKADSRFTVTPATATNSRNATFGWTGSNATSFKCKINAQPEQQNCTSPQSYDSTKTIEGLNTFTVTASNASGPDQYPAVYKWTVDSVPPPATAICTAVGNPPAVPETCPDQGELTHSRTASISFSNLPDTNIGRVECKLEGPGQTQGFKPCQSPKTYTDLQSGHYTVQRQDFRPGQEPGIAGCHQELRPGDRTVVPLGAGQPVAATAFGRGGPIHHS